jgi:hypothetical protein
MLPVTRKRYFSFSSNIFQPGQIYLDLTYPDRLMRFTCGGYLFVSGKCEYQSIWSAPTIGAVSSFRLVVVSVSPVFTAFAIGK